MGALTRHADLARSAVAAEYLPLLPDALRHVAHAAVRNRGTIGGSFAHSDPAAELPACAVALDAAVVLVNRSGRREVPARSFFRGLFDTDRRPGELIVEILFRPRRAGQRHAFLELSRRQGDFALIGLAAVLQTCDGRVTEADFVYFGASQPPALSLAAADALRGRALPLLEDWVEAAVTADLELVDAPGLRVDTKLKLAAALTKRVLRRLGEADAAPIPLASASSSVQNRGDGAASRAP